MKQVRILHVIQSPAWGGLELYTVELIRKLAETKLEQYVLCAEKSRVAEELKNSKIPIITFSDKKISKFKVARLIRKVCAEKKITHLHSHTRLDMWACALSHWRSHRPAHVYNLYMNAPPKNDLVHRWLFSKVDALCSSSEFVLNEARKNFPIAPEKLRLVRYGRETRNYHTSPEKRARLRQEMGLKEGELSFGTLCRIDPGKGVREMVEALDHLSDSEIQKLHLVIVGEPTIHGRDEHGGVIYEPASLTLADWVDKQAQSPRLKGHLHRVPFQKDYIPMIDALDIFILASYNETYSLSVLDAMLMKKPVIGTDAGGTTEQVGKHERGRLVRPKDSKDLAEAIRYYLQNPEKASEQGDMARAWVLEQHPWEKTLQITLDLYQEL